MHDLYADGGVIGRNPSAIGGTWAWRRVYGDVVTGQASGVVRPEDLGNEKVSNNNTELLALLNAIEALPPGWRGRVNSDSGIALGWVFKGYKLDSVPEPLAVRLKTLLDFETLEGLTYRLLAGHPTKADLEAGVRARLPSYPVSVHNVHCDAECRRLAGLEKAK